MNAFTSPAFSNLWLQPLRTATPSMVLTAGSQRLVSCGLETTDPYKQIIMQDVFMQTKKEIKENVLYNCVP